MPMPQKPTPKKLCHTCKKVLKRKRFGKRLEDLSVFMKRKYCSRKCMAKGQEKDICKSIKHSREKARLLTADRIKCEICDIEHQRLHTHHIDGNPRNNKLSNLMKLCSSCHRRIHSPWYDKNTGKRKSCAFCTKPCVKIGLCNIHLTRYKKYGHPLAKKKKIGHRWYLMLFDGKKWMPFCSKIKPSDWES